MQEEETLTAPPVEGNGLESPPQETPPEAQAPEEPQETDVPKVDGTVQPASSNGETRKPSEFYKERQLYKRKIENLESQISEVLKRLDSKQQPNTVTPPTQRKHSFDEARLFAKPQEVINEILAEERKLMAEEIKKEILENYIPKVYSETEKKRTFEKEQQEALELIFPKSGADDKRSVKQRMDADPERTAKVQEMLDETGIDLISEKSPLKAAKALLKFLDEKKETPKNPNVIKKALVGSTATGSPAGGGKKVATLNEIKAQLNALDVEVDKNPDIKYEPTFIQKKQALKSQLSALAKELKGNQ